MKNDIEDFSGVTDLNWVHFPTFWRYDTLILLPQRTKKSNATLLNNNRYKYLQKNYNLKYADHFMVLYFLLKNYNCCIIPGHT